MDNTPDYYKTSQDGMDIMDMINALGWGHEFRKGNVLKYLARAGKKTKSPCVDLKKAKSYLDAEIAACESEESAHAHTHAPMAKTPPIVDFTVKQAVGDPIYA